MTTSNDNIDSDDTSINNLEYDSDLSNYDYIGNVQNNNETIKEREMGEIDQDLYAKPLFTTRIGICHMLSIYKLSSFDILS